jgi:hypothetical protein
MQTYYAIRRLYDGKLMPDTGTGKRSRTEFEDYGPPRLFMTIGGAKTSLSMWCQGIWALETEWESTNEYGEGYYVSGLPVPLGKHQRNPVDYEVISVSLNIKE